VVAALAICGCDSPVASAPPAASSDLAFDFRLSSGPGVMDQVLLIGNRGQTGLAPVLELTPLDETGDPMPGVTVKTAYGSDAGRVVAPPRSTVIDVLRFRGPRARDVADVDVRVTRSAEVPDAEPGELLVQPLGRTGRPVNLDDFFYSSRVTNKSDAEARARVVLIEWENPPPGESQQALRVTPVSPLITIPPHGRRTVPLPKDLRGRVIGTVKAYFSR